MKKKLSICAAAFIALAMTGCDNGKTGTIEGEVRDAFTNKPLEMPTVGMDSTIYTTLSKKYEFNQELRKGKFKFVKVPVGAYRVYAGRSKYVKTRMKIETTEQNPNASLILYIYSAQVDPGLYQGTPEGPLKIDNKWVVYSTNCDESIAGYRLTMPQQQAGDAKANLAEKIGVKKKGKRQALLKRLASRRKARRARRLRRPLRSLRSQLLLRTSRIRVLSMASLKCSTTTLLPCLPQSRLRPIRLSSLRSLLTRTARALAQAKRRACSRSRTRQPISRSNTLLKTSSRSLATSRRASRLFSSPRTERLSRPTISKPSNSEYV